MSEEKFDVNKIATELATKGIEAAYGKSAGLLKGISNTVRVKLQRSYRDYLQCVDDRYSKAKSFFNRTEAVYLYEFYIPTGISFGRAKISNVTVAEIANLHPFMVLIGGGGSGKSMLMRHLFLDTLKAGNRVPVFLELRLLNDQSQTLLDFISENLRLNKFDFDADYIEKAMKAGHFVFLLDGFDEVVHSRRNQLSKQIQQLQKKYDQNMILVSSRADNIFAGWAAFGEGRVMPLDLNQAVKLVTKLPFDEDIKAKFVADLQDELFKKHESFLSNPLLLSIMLLTYSQSADIPNKLNIFYSQAYEALFQRHDALKGGYQRERQSSLDIQDFARVFSAFSIQTYDARKFSMTKAEALDYLEKAKKLSGINFNSEDYLADAHQAVCLLVEEGLFLSFTHRSFQEYFAAKFISESPTEQQRKLLNKYSEYLDPDEVFNLLYEIKPDLMEKEFIVPFIAELEEKLDFRGKVNPLHLLKLLKLNFEEIGFAETGDMVFFRDHHREIDRDYATCMSYVLDNCRRLLPSYKEVEYDRKLMNEKYNKGGHSDSFKLDDLTSRSDFLIDISNSGGFFSAKTLSDLFAIKKLLMKKHNGANASLNQILKI